MKKINFGSLSVRTGIGADTTTRLNIKESFANMLYTQVNGIAALTLAQKIYKSEGETEYDEIEVKVLTEVIDNICRAAIVDAYHKIIDNN